MSDTRSEMKSAATATSTTSAIVDVRVRLSVTPDTKRWGAYGVVDEDGALSWETYPDPESAKHDRLFRGRARIIRLRMDDVGTEAQRELSRGELRRSQTEEPSSATRTDQPDGEEA